MQIYILYACKSYKKIKKLLISFMLFGRVGFAAGLRLQVRGRQPCARKLQKELPPVALLQQRHIGFRTLRAFRLRPHGMARVLLRRKIRIFFFYGGFILSEKKEKKNWKSF